MICTCVVGVHDNQKSYKIKGNIIFENTSKAKKAWKHEDLKTCRYDVHRNILNILLKYTIYVIINKLFSKTHKWELQLKYVQNMFLSRVDWMIVMAVRLNSLIRPLHLVYV